MDPKRPPAATPNAGPDRNALHTPPLAPKPSVFPPPRGGVPLLIGPMGSKGEVAGVDEQRRQPIGAEDAEGWREGQRSPQGLGAGIWNQSSCQLWASAARLRIFISAFVFNFISPLDVGIDPGSRLLLPQSTMSG